MFPKSYGPSALCSLRSMFIHPYVFSAQYLCLWGNVFVPVITGTKTLPNYGMAGPDSEETWGRGNIGPNLGWKKVCEGTQGWGRCNFWERVCVSPALCSISPDFYQPYDPSIHVLSKPYIHSNPFPSILFLQPNIFLSICSLSPLFPQLYVPLTVCPPSPIIWYVYVVCPLSLILS